MSSRILVVDDETEIRNVLREVLEFHGYVVAAAGDGLEAIRLFQEEPADLIITDIVMPEKEGLETIMDLRRSHPEVKIIAISGGGVAGPHGYLTPAVKLGADRALAKPFTMQELMAVVRELLGEGAQT